MKRATMREPIRSNRRRFLVVAGGAVLAGAASGISPRAARATPDAMKAAIRDVLKGATVRPGRVKFDVPPLVENGNTVPITVSVTSPMTEADHVVSIHIFNEKNPQPNVGNFYLGPRAGRGQVSTRIRLADTQTLTAIAKLSDGSFWSTTADVVVTLAACTEEAS
jgi:sulfur-oxidizing protein SoxY